MLANLHCPAAFRPTQLNTGLKQLYKHNTQNNNKSLKTKNHQTWKNRNPESDSITTLFTYLSFIIFLCFREGMGSLILTQDQDDTWQRWSLSDWSFSLFLKWVNLWYNRKWRSNKKFDEKIIIINITQHLTVLWQVCTQV